MKRYLFFFTFILGYANIFAGDTVSIRNGMFGIDNQLKIVIVNQDINNINTEWPSKKDAIYMDGLYTMEIPLDDVQRGIGYPIINDQGDKYTLYFTQSPLIFITATQEIVDEPKVPAKFTMIESNANKITEDIGIEIRGLTSQYFYRKKSYKIVFRENAQGENNKDVSLLGMRSDDDWNLQAMAPEPLRMNGKTSYDIWMRMNTLYYQSSEPDAVNGCRMKYAELFVNDEYKGIYCVSEPIDRKQLKLKKYDDKKGIRGELYKNHGWGLAHFSNCPPYDNNSREWNDKQGHGYECIYPTEVYPDWKYMYDFVYLVVYGSDNQFYSQYQNHFNFGNAVDYFIFLNIARALDNTSHNLFVARYNANEPYFYVPWDLDGTFGNIGGKKDSRTDSILGNGFYKRLLKDYSENGFRQKVEARWKLLRDDWLTASGLMDMFRENYDYLVEDGVYEREELIWKDKDNYYFDSQYIEYLQDWITKRLSYLDTEFNYTTNIPKIDVQKIQYPCDIRIYNMSGQLVKEAYSIRSENEIPYHNLNRGIYFIQLRNSVLWEVKKIIIR